MDGKHCKFCKNNQVRLTYSITQEDYLCLDCYKDQFSKEIYKQLSTETVKPIFVKYT